MEPPPRPSSSLFEVYLRLRPSTIAAAERFLDVESAATSIPTHITIKPPATDYRKRAVERFAFTRVFEEDAAQLDILKGTGVLQLIEGVLGPEGREGRDGLLATLGVTGSGKSHTILGSKTQRGLTQLALDVLYQCTGSQLINPATTHSAFSSLVAADVSEAHLLPASAFLDNIYTDCVSERGNSRAATPMLDSSFLMPSSAPKRYIPRPSALPQYPVVDDVTVAVDRTAEYAIVISMYEVYNDRIFDLLSGSVVSKGAMQKRRALLFKSTEHSPDRKVVAGLRKIVCGSLDEALIVLETGLLERKVAGTGSNAVSSRSHGFFCIEVKKRSRSAVLGPWTGSALTIVDLAGSERARNAKTAGATLAEAGKINESLMYLGQCMQMQSDNQDSNKQNVVPFRQCKLTELLFSNSFPSSSSNSSTHHVPQHHRPQKAIMIVTADPVGDFNATSQILRYSALAREVTVPRIPSVTSTILGGSSKPPPAYLSGRTTPSATAEELEHALAEPARLAESVDVLQLQLSEERRRRLDAEASWAAAEQRATAIEQAVRDECVDEMEARVAAEAVRWKAAWSDAAERHDSHLDAKLELLSRGIGTQIQIREDTAPSDNERVRELEDENEGLRRRIEIVQREVGLRSPSKKMRVLKAKKVNCLDAGYEGSP